VVEHQAPGESGKAMTAWVILAALGLVGLVPGTNLLVRVRPRLPRPQGETKKGNSIGQRGHDRVSSLTPGPVVLQGRIVACGETLADVGGERCVLIRTRVRAQVDWRWGEAHDHTEVVPAELHDDTGACRIELAGCEVSPMPTPFERDDAQLWLYTPSLAKRLLSPGAMDEAIQRKLRERGGGKERVRFSVSRVVVPDGVTVRAEGHVARVVSEASGYRDSLGALVVESTTRRPLVVAIEQPPADDKQERPPASRARPIVTVIGAVLIAHAAVLWAMLAILYLSVR
jgi:hypothetical protein